MNEFNVQIKRYSFANLDVSEVINFYRSFGYILIEDFLTNETVINIKNIISELHKKEVKNNEAFKYADNVDRVWNLVNKHILFSELITNPLISTLMNLIFDRDTKHQKFYLSSFQATIVRPEAKAQALHIDTPVPNPLPLWEIKANTIWLLDKFTDKNGATEIIPGSHRYGRRPVDADINDHSGIIKIQAPAGSLLITSGYLWHRAGANLSNSTRRALLGSFASSAFREISSEEDIVRASLQNGMFKMSEECWNIVGGRHGIKRGYFK
jgi:ectoine hydroxylase-related dioxygenase (phytanoyl-CoA dioxygenase family)